MFSENGKCKVILLLQLCQQLDQVDFLVGLRVYKLDCALMQAKNLPYLLGFFLRDSLADSNGSNKTTISGLKVIVRTSTRGGLRL